MIMSIINKRLLYGYDLCLIVITVNKVFGQIIYQKRQIKIIIKYLKMY